MSDEDLRALERAASTDDGARLVLALALLRAGDAIRATVELRRLIGAAGAPGAQARRKLLELAGPAGAAEVAAELAPRMEAIELSDLLRLGDALDLATRAVLVRALRAKDKRAAQALARELPRDPFASLLAAEGEIVM